MKTDPTLILAFVFFMAAVALGTFTIIRGEAYRQRIETDAYNKAYAWATKEITEGKMSPALLDARVQKRLRSNPTTAYDRGVLAALRDHRKAKFDMMAQQATWIRQQ